MDIRGQEIRTVLSDIYDELRALEQEKLEQEKMGTKGDRLKEIEIEQVEWREGLAAFLETRRQQKQRHERGHRA